MAILYKTFKPLRIVFFSLFLLVLAFQAGEKAHAANPLYTVEDITVDVTSSSATKARDEAFNKAQQDAFAVLAGRMVSESEAARFAATDPGTISPMLQNFEVTKEQLSRVRYVGTYTFTFDEEVVRSFFAQKGTAFNDTANPPSLVLPFFQKGEQTLLWDENNLWMQAWGRAGDLKGATPLVVPIGDVMDVSDIQDDQLNSYDPQKLQSMMQRYNVSEAVIIAAIPDAALLGSMPGSPAMGYVDIQIYYPSASGAQLVSTTKIIANGQEEVDALYNRAVTEARAALRSGASAAGTEQPPAPYGTQSARMEVRVHFSGLEEWARAQRELKTAYGVRDVMVKSLSPTQALIELGYQGDVENLRLALAQHRMVLIPPPSLTSYPTPYEAASASSVYELRLNGPAMPTGVPVNDY